VLIFATKTAHVTSYPILRGKTPLPPRNNEFSLKGLLHALPLAIAIIAAVTGILIAIFYGLEPGSFLFRFFMGPVGKFLEKLQPAFSTNNPFVEIPLLLVAIYVGILIHELGHVVAGLAVRFPFVYVMVGPVRLTRTKDSFKVTLHKPEMGGLAMHLPKGRRRSWKGVLFVLGGPLANMAVFALTPIALRTAIFPALLCVISFFLAVISLIPFHTKGFASDGMLIWRALSSPRHRIRDVAVAYLAREIEKKRAREFRATWVNRALQSSGPTPNTFLAHWIAYWYFNDRKEWDRAAASLETCLALTPFVNEAMRDLCILEAAVFHAWAWDDLAGAHNWKTLVPDSAIEPVRLVRWQIVEATARRDHAVLQFWQDATKFIAENPDENLRAILSESWAEFREDIESRLQLAPGKARAASA
jgi:hypothetical protein